MSGTNKTAAAPADGALWAAVENLVGADYELHGELSASADGQRVVYVAARRTGDRSLVLLALDRAALGNYELAFGDTLDETIPARDVVCRHCAQPLATWAATCAVCGRRTTDTSIVRADWSDTAVRPVVTALLGASSTVLGGLPTASGTLLAVGRVEPQGEVHLLSVERGTAVSLVRLRRLAMAAVRRVSSPHSGELGPLAETERVLVAGDTVGIPPTIEQAPVGDLPLQCPSCQSRYEAGLRYCPVDGAELGPAAGTGDLVGRTLGGKFKVLKLLGEGGMGRVYLAEHVRMGRRCALKVLSPGLVGHPDAIKRFGGEARNASRIAHPHVATVYDLEETSDGLVYIVLEFIDGETLGAILTREGRLDVTRAVRIARDTADALQAAHDLGIVHRDLKPDNIMIARGATGEDVVKVVDFGIAKAAEGAANTRVTRTGFVVGTPRYMSPEQFAGVSVDARSDLYSLGCVLYETITGLPAYEAPVTTERTLRQQPRLREDAPRALDAIITRAMARTQDARYQSAREMRDALDLVLDATARRRAAQQRQLALRIGGAVAAVAMLAVGAFALFGRRSAQPPAPTPTISSALSPAPPTTPTSAPTQAQAPTPVPVTHKHVPTAKPTTPPPAPAPEPAAVMSPEVGRYVAHVDSVVHAAWRDALEGSLPKGTERAAFNLAVGPRGRVVHVTPVRLSNVSAYDDALSTALQRITTFGPIPTALVGDRGGTVLHLVFQGSSLTVHVADHNHPQGATTPDR